MVAKNRHTRKAKKAAPGALPIADRLRELLALTGMSQAQCARAVGADPTRVTEWLSGLSTPGAAYLRRFGDAFGVSVDWLLGYEVPEERAARTEVGEVARAFAREIAGRHPWEQAPHWRPAAEEIDRYTAFHLESATAGGSGALEALLRQAANAWWMERMRSHAGLWLGRLRGFAARLEADAHTGDHGDPEGPSFSSVMLHHARHVREEAHLLARRAESGDVDAWMQLHRLDQPRRIPIASWPIRTSVVRVIKFPVMGGVGFAYQPDRRRARVRAWYIDAVTAEIKYQEGDMAMGARSHSDEV